MDLLLPEERFLYSSRQEVGVECPQSIEELKVKVDPFCKVSTTLY